MSESTGTLRVKRQSSCAMSIVEISQDGRFVKLSNGSSNKDFDLTDFTLERKHPKGVSTYAFPKGFKVNAGKQFQVWAARFEDDAPKGELVADASSCKTWGTGNGDLVLKNKLGETKCSSSMAYELKN